MDTRIVLVDYGCGLDPWKLWAVAEAATLQTHRDVGRPPPYGYGATATVRVAADPNDVLAHEWVVAYLPVAGPPGALGYHDRTASGQPLIHVFPFLDDPAMRGLVETHEIIETLVDPTLDKMVPDSLGRLVAVEPGDPVETTWYPLATRYGFVPVTNFATPAYYQPAQFPQAAYDFLGLLRYPGDILPGGYNTVLTPGVGWVRVSNGGVRPYRDLEMPVSRIQGRALRYPAM